MDVTKMSASVILAKIRKGELTVSEYVNVLLERCNSHKRLNAFISLNSEKIKEAALNADKIFKSGGVLGPLHGLPVVLKDNIDTVGMPTTAGTPALKNHQPDKNAPLVQKLLDAGAIIFGKANLHELAQGITNNNYHFGPARNPYNPNYIPGGSSGGCGVSVGARLVPVGIGTDTGGSVRIPAALCGIVGYRPTVGRYSQEGIIPISHTRDTAGPMARSVKDAILLDGILSGRKKEIVPANLKGLRLGVPRNPFYRDIDSSVETVIEEALSRLKNYGIELIEADLPDVSELDQKAGFAIALYESVIDLNKYLELHRSSLNFASIVSKVASPDVKTILGKQLRNDAIKKDDYFKALNSCLPALRNAYEEYFLKHRVSAIVFPTTPAPAIPIGEDETFILNRKTVPVFSTFIRNTDPSSLIANPGISLPAGISKEGLPIGMELDCRFGNDDKLLSIALAVEEQEPEIDSPELG